MTSTTLPSLDSQPHNTPSTSSIPKGGGQAVCLRGFTPSQATAAAAWLQERGFRVVRSLEAAQLVLAGPEAEKGLMDLAQGRGLKLQRWEAFRERHAQTVASPVTVTSEQAATAPFPADDLESKPLPLVEHDEAGQVMILGMPFQKPTVAAADAKLVPSAARFAHICLDQLFVNTVAAVAQGARWGYPVALEGETAASKTTAVLWLAHLLGQPVARLNLNGQTDAGELVGRHVPANALGGLQSADLLAHPALLKPATRRLLEQAVAEGRNLNALEQALVARTECLPATQWRFQESSLPQAMRRGWWLLLDEMNLAEPQILERLNSALETPPTLVLSEGDGTVFGPGGDVLVQKDFRLFATLNPAEYSGRSVLSPAFRDRWSIWHQAEVPTEAEIGLMLRLLVFGEQPVVHFQGRRFQGAPAEPSPAFAGWGSFDRTPVENVLNQLALFHISVARAAGSQGVSGLARHQRERLTFTRRTLLNVMQHVSHAAQEAGTSSNSDLRRLLRQALDVFYINRLRDAGDRKAVLTMLRAADLT
jgi:MoxR-like ATPase